MRFCQACGSQLDTAAKFCPSCGAALEAPTQTPPKSPKKKNSGAIVVLVFIGTGVFLCGGLALLGALAPDATPSPTPVAQGSTAPAAKTPSQSKSTTPASKPTPKQWTRVGKQGQVLMIYVSSALYKDRCAMGRILNDVAPGRGFAMVHIYDSKARVGLPMTDNNMLHWRASYTRNPNTGHEQFQWFRVTNRRTSPPELDSRNDTIRPGKC